MSFCKKCGVKLPEDAAFCPKCGTPLAASTVHEEEGEKTSFSGTYALEAQGVTVTLVLLQDAQGKISGVLSSTRGMRFQVDGQVEEDTAVGTCHDEKGGVYFEATLEENQLSLSLIEPGNNNMPDYNRTRQLTLTRHEREIPSEPLPEPPAAPSVEVSDQFVGNPNWGFKFQPPIGWKSQIGDSAAILGHDTIAGVILVLPHMATSFQQVQQQMLQGIKEEGTHLSLASALHSISNNAIAGDYVGIYNGQQVKARGIGTLSPYVGGAYIIALTVPEKYSRELADAAEAIARGMQYLKAQASDLVQHFAGTWVNYTRSTETRITLTPNGDYFENYEAIYSGQFGSGGQNGSWGTARQDQERGRWSVRGNREQGQIIITFQDGRQTVVGYRVHVERGQTYWNEYYFNGELYGKQ